MIEASVGIFSPASSGGGVYTFSLFFENNSQARYLRVGDYVTDSVGNSYEITTWTGFPSDFTSSGTVTVNFITTDTLPVQDAGFNSVTFTPGQVDLRPVFRSAGSIGTISTFLGQNFEYQVSASWNDLTAANQAQVGDYIVDSLGNFYEITFLTANKFSDPFRIKEVDEVGEPPVQGIATIFRPTSNFRFFQGTQLTDPARNNAAIRDKVIIDQNLGQGSGSGSGDSLQTNYTNSSGVLVQALTPVDINGNLINVSNESSVFSIAGVTNEAAADAVTSTLTISGLIKNVTTAFNVGDVLYLNTDGSLTSLQPDIGVGFFLEGDFVVKVAKVLENQDNPSNKDLLVNINIVGQL